MGVLLLMQVSLVMWLASSAAHDPAALGTGVFAFTYTLALLTRFFNINHIIRQLSDTFTVAAPMAVVLEEQAEIKDAEGAQTLEVKSGVIEIKDVDFKYSDTSGALAVFEKLSLRIQPGEKIGLVGHSGGGKTTLTRLLLRFEDIQSGQILVDGQDISQVTQASLRDAISYVPQEPLLFHRSIRENIAYGKPDTALSKIKTAAGKAHADDFIEKLPDGYDTIVGERGVKLSGGQRQRVAISRAILKNAPILVLDEATSALDSESEKAIQSALWELMKDKTAIVIAHRLSTIQRLDRIIVLDEGKIIEEGSHAALLKQKNGLYAKLWAHQSGGFLEQ
jgi:ATP-binding cassette subfamily B protein